MCCYIYGVLKTTLVIRFSSYIGLQCLVFIQVIFDKVAAPDELSISQRVCVCVCIFLKGKRFLFFCAKKLHPI